MQVIQENTGFSPNNLILAIWCGVLWCCCRTIRKRQSRRKTLITMLMASDIGSLKHKVVKERSASAHGMMKILYDWPVENHFFLPGNQVLAILITVSSANHYIPTSKRRSLKQIYHANLWKPYYAQAHWAWSGTMHIGGPPCMFVSVCFSSYGGRASRRGPVGCMVSLKILSACRT